MELDKRIKEGKRPLTCFDVKEAKQFIGKECYFSNYLCNFNDINSIAPRALLHNITEDKDASNPYYSCPGYFAYCLPGEWVEEEKNEPEKKYRAFTIKEFQQKYSVGSVLKIRQKQNRFTESVVQYVGYKVYEERIYLGITDFTLDELFENFEMIEPQSDTWQPFGIIDE